MIGMTGAAAAALTALLALLVPAAGHALHVGDSDPGGGATILAPDLSVSITDNQTAAVPGTPVTYTIQAQNSGIGAANGAKVVSTLSGALQNVAWTCVPAGGATCSSSGTGEIADSVVLPAGATATYTVTGTIAPRPTGSLKSSVAIQPAPGFSDPVPDNNEATDSDILTPVADLAVAVAGPPSATPGATVAYAVTVKNAGPSDATGVLLYLPAAPGLVLTTAGAPCGNGFPCSLGTLAAGGQVTVGATYALPAGYLPGGVGGVGGIGPDPILVTAAVAAATPDPVAGNGSARAATPVGRAAVPDLRLAVSGPPSAAKGSTVTYTVKVTNQGKDDAPSFTLQQTAPPGLFRLATSDPCRGGLPCTLGPLNAGAQVAVKVTWGIPAGYTGANRLAYRVSLQGATAGTATAKLAVPLGPDTADLGVAVTAPAGITVGGDLPYTYTVSNRGPGAAVNVVLSDPVPAGLVLVNADAPCAGGFPCNLGTLAAGRSVRVRATFKLQLGWSGGALVRHTASVASATVEGDAGDNSAVLLSAISAEAVDLAVTALAPGSVAAGSPLTYTFLVTNRGPGTSHGTSLQLPAPGHLPLTFAAAPCAANQGFPCALGDLAPGAAIAVTASYRVAANHVSPNPLEANVRVVSNDIDPVAGNNTATASAPVVRVADLEVTKTDGRTAVAAGLPLTYTLKVTNRGPSDVAGVKVDDDVPAGLAGFNWNGPNGRSGTGGAGIHDTLNLTAGSTVTYNASSTVTAAARGSIRNTATARVPTGATDPVAANNSATDSDSVLAAAGLLVQISGPASVAAGRDLALTFDLFNNGAGSATALALAVPTPAGLTLASATPCPGGFPCSLPDLPPGQSTQVRAVYAVPANYSAANPLVFNASATTPTAGDNQTTLRVTVDFTTDLAIAMTTGRANLVPGEPVTYQILVANAGPSDAVRAKVTDTPPAALLAPAWSCAAATGAHCGAASGTGGIGAIADTVTIPAGATLTYVLNATLDPAATTAVVNAATVSAAAGATDPNLGNNIATATSGLAPKADLAVTVSNGLATASLIATGPLAQFTVNPCRVLDTRNPPGPTGGPALSSGVERTFQITGSCGIPATAKAIIANLTVIAPSGLGNLQTYPAGSPPPNTTTINFSPGKSRANNAIIRLGPNGALGVTAFTTSGNLQFVLDVTGYFQ